MDPGDRLPTATSAGAGVCGKPTVVRDALGAVSSAGGLGRRKPRGTSGRRGDQRRCVPGRDSTRDGCCFALGLRRCAASEAMRSRASARVRGLAASTGLRRSHREGPVAGAIGLVARQPAVRGVEVAAQLGGGRDDDVAVGSLEAALLSQRPVAAPRAAEGTGVLRVDDGSVATSAGIDMMGEARRARWFWVCYGLGRGVRSRRWRRVGCGLGWADGSAHGRGGW
jgi:hypothetical protein